MFKRISSASILAAAATMASAYMPVPLLIQTPQGPQPIPGQIFIKIKPGKESTVFSLTKKMKGKVGRSLPRIGWQLINLPAGMTYEQANAQFRSNPNVLNTCPNYIATADSVTVNDPQFNRQYSMQKMQVPAAWDFSTGSASTIVAVVDSGVDYTHPELKNKVIKGRDCIAGDNDPMDVNGHGTHVAGIVAAETNNGAGIAGVGYKTKVLAVRVLGDNGSGSFDAITEGILYAADNGANIINMSLGARGLASMPVTDDALQYAINKNCVIIASAGNSGAEGNPINYPGYNPLCISVGASDENDKRGDFSEYNPVDGSDNWVDVAAPGVQVLSSVMGGKFESWDGTSMAAPNVSGVASLIWTSLTELGTAPTNDQVRRYIEENTDNIGTWVNYGRVNAYNSLASIGIPISDVPTPTVPAPYDGTVSYTTGSFSATDGVSATIRSAKRPGVGLTGAFTTSFTMDDISSDELRSATISLKITAEKLATVQLFVQDLSGSWKMLATAPGNPSGKTTDLNLTKSALTNYLTGAGKLNVMVRSFIPVRLASRAKGVAQVDLLQVVFKGVRRPNAAP